MALSIDPLTYIITIPQADLSPEGGTLYSLDTNAFRLALKAWEYDEEGIVQLVTHIHNTEVSVAGTTFARSIEIIPPYSITFEDGQYTVILEGSNNNIFDVASGILNQNQVQIISQNSAGLVVVASGSVTGQDIIDITDAVWDEPLTGGTHNIPTSSGRRLRQLGDIIAAEVVDGSPTTVTFITDLTEVTDDWYNDQLVRFTAGNLIGIVRPILSYNGTSKAITITEDLPFAPDNGSLFDIIPTHVHPMEEIVNSIWDEDITIHTTTDSAGEALIAASAADSITVPTADEVADAVWDETAADHVAPDTMGEQAEDTLKKAKLAAFKL